MMALPWQPRIATEKDVILKGLFQGFTNTTHVLDERLNLITQMLDLVDKCLRFIVSKLAKSFQFGYPSEERINLN